MSQTIRFPLLTAVPSVGPAETSLVVTINAGINALLKGGTTYTSIAAWKTIQRSTESPFTCVAIEFSAPAEMTIGDGTFAEQIGLFGQIDSIPFPTLIGVLGIARGGVAPQIPLVQKAAGPTMIGYTQLVSNVAVYDSLAVGGVSGDIVLDPGIALTIRARPIRSREYLG